MKRNLILAGVTVVVAFLWIWLFSYTGAKAFWVALISFGFYLAADAQPKKLPWMTLGGALGVAFGLATYYMAMLVLPMNASISIAIAGTLFILVGAVICLLLGLIRPGIFLESFPMYLLGWGGFLGAIFRYDFLFIEKVTESMPRVMSTFFGVLLSVLVGLLLGALVGTPILKMGKKEEGAGEGIGEVAIEKAE